jgi:DNA-binding transcriptional LysR family regulator
MVDPRRVLTFREVARLGSFSRAAEALSLTQPAVSQQVAALERQAGAQLLERGPGGLALTPAGALLLEHADVVADRLDLASGQLAELVGHAARELRIGAFPSALATRVPQALARLIAERPETKADVAEGTTDELVERVRSGAVHVAICFQDAAAPRREHEGAERVDLGEEPFVAMLPPGHPLAGRGPLRLKDLADDLWAAPSREGIIARACEAAGFTAPIRYVSRDPLANRGLVAAGLAVTISPADLAAEFTGIAAEPLRDGPSRTVYALLPASGATPLARAFVAALEGAGNRHFAGPSARA